MYEKKYYWDVLARAYTLPRNSHKELDADLIMDMADLLVKTDEAVKYMDRVHDAMELKEDD